MGTSRIQPPAAQEPESLILPAPAGLTATSKDGDSLPIVAFEVRAPGNANSPFHWCSPLAALSGASWPTLRRCRRTGSRILSSAATRSTNTGIGLLQPFAPDQL